MIQSVVRSVVRSIGTNAIGRANQFWQQQNLFASGRSDLTIPATNGISPNILLPYYKRLTLSSYAYVSDNGALDIGTDDFTICGWFNSSGILLANRKGIVGKGIQLEVTPAGWYGIFAEDGTKCISASIKTSDGLINIYSTISADSPNWFFYRMDVNQLTNKFRLFINEVQIGSDTSFTGTFPALDNKYKFYLGGCNLTADGNYAYPSLTSFSDNYVFHKLLTDQEALTLFNRGTVTAAAAHWSLTSQREGFDLSGNGLHLTQFLSGGAGWNEIEVTQGFSSAGSRQSLEKGYSLYTKDLFKDFYIPYGDDGNPLTSPTVPIGYVFSKNVAGISNGYNLCDAMIEFSNDEWDRSDTDRCTVQARVAPATLYAALSYYLVNNIKAWHVSELNRFVMDYYYNPDYQYQAFVKILNNSQDDRLSLSELFSYPKKIVGKQLASVYLDTGDTYNFLKSTGNPIIAGSSFGTVVYIDTTHFILYYSNTTNILRALSSDGITFTADTPNNPILTGGSVVVVWIEGNTWYMLYRYKPGSHYLIGLATSTDGITWTPSVSNPVLQGTPGTWDAPNTGIDPWGIIKVGSTYYLHINNIGTDPRQGGVATSTDLVNWTEDAQNPILTQNRFCSGIFKYKNYYYLIVTKKPSFGSYEPNKYYQRFELYRDINPTFYSSERQFLGNILYARSCDVNLPYDWEYLDTPMVLTTDIQRTIYPNNKIRMYYSGYSTGGVWQHALVYGDLNMIHNLPVITIPFKPINLSCSELGDTVIQVNFTNDAFNATGFSIERSTTDETNYTEVHTITGSGESQSWIDTTCSASTKYYYRIRTINGTEYSVYSDSANATTTASLGSELVDQANWYKNTYWGVYRDTWTQDGVTFRSIGSGSKYAAHANMWTIGKVYRIRITITLAASSGFMIYDNVAIGPIYAVQGTYTYAYDYTVQGVNIWIVASLTSHDTILSALSIREYL